MEKTVITIDNFNSIKVRLNQKPFHSKGLLLLFQFHKGTIKPISRTRRHREILQFQFHKGTIKPEPSPSLPPPPPEFQFHKGTIKPEDGQRT